MNRSALYALLDIGGGSRISRYIGALIMTLIVLNVGVAVAETFDDIPGWMDASIGYFDIISVVVFTLEYGLRIVTADFLFPDVSPGKARFQFMFSFMGLVDLLAILTILFSFLLPFDLRILRALRLMRLVTLFKFSRYDRALSALAEVFRQKASHIAVSVLFAVILLTIASVVMYHIEHEAQPEAFSNAFAALWWAVASFTTVGYGDIYPVTPLGRFFGGIVSVLGIGLLAAPIGIISAGFMEHVEKNRREQRKDKPYCPYCGGHLE